MDGPAAPAEKRRVFGPPRSRARLVAAVITFLLLTGHAATAALAQAPSGPQLRSVSYVPAEGRRALLVTRWSASVRVSAAPSQSLTSA